MLYNSLYHLKINKQQKKTINKFNFFILNLESTYLAYIYLSLLQILVQRDNDGPMVLFDLWKERKLITWRKKNCFLMKKELFFDEKGKILMKILNYKFETKIFSEIKGAQTTNCPQDCGCTCTPLLLQVTLLLA